MSGETLQAVALKHGSSMLAERIINSCRAESIPPCQAACPAGIRVRDYVEAITRADYEAALKIILERIPFPAVCGRICPHPCEENCYRGRVDDPIAISALKRFVADRTCDSLPSVKAPPRKERVAIVGAGPAGLTAAYHLALKGYPVTVFESHSEPGGMLILAIPDYKLPRDIVRAEIKRIESLGVEIMTNTFIGSTLSVPDLFRQGFKAVFVATGAPHSRKLGIPGEEGKGVYSGLDFLTGLKLGKGVTVGQKVAVIGGGDVAIDTARCALRLGAEVTVFYHRSRQEMPASNSGIEAALEEGARVEYLATPKKIINQGGRAVALVCQRTELGEPDSSGRRRPLPVPDSDFRTDIDMVLTAIGQQPDLSLLPGDVKSTEQGAVTADPVTLATDHTGIFAGGDVQTGPATAIDAIAAGIRAATSIDRYLTGQDLREGREDKECPVLLFLEKTVEQKHRYPVPKIDLDERKHSFVEVKLGLSEEDARNEAARCLSCECRLCVRDCEFLKRLDITPKQLAQSFRDDSLPLDSKVPYLCNLCGLCQKVCPEDLNIGDMCLAVRSQRVSQGLTIPTFHQKVVADQAWVTSDAFALSQPDPNTGRCERFFFPGCSLSARSPDLVVKTLKYLQEKLPGTGVILGCCGAPTHDIGDQRRFQQILDSFRERMDRFGTSEMVIACPECYHTFKHNAPDIRLSSVYEVIIEHGLPVTGTNGSDGRTFAIHDSCKTRDERELQESIRTLVRELGYNIEEMEYSRNMTRCCGMGGMVPFADLKLWNAVSKRRASETPHDIITYCAGCQESFTFVGKPTVHILDLLFNQAGKNNNKDSPLSRAARQENQSRLRSELIAIGSRPLKH